jgi:hypothetical protein
MEETVRRGTRRALDEKEQEPSSGGLYGSQIDASHMVGAAIAELVGTFILIFGGTAVAVGAILSRPTAGPPTTPSPWRWPSGLRSLPWSQP